MRRSMAVSAEGNRMEALRRQLPAAWGGALLLALCMTGSAHAQGIRVTGRVSDAHDAVLPGATITLTSLTGGPTRTATTDDGGRYAITDLTPGTYRIRAELEGFRPEERARVAVADDLPGPTEVDFMLSLAEGAPERVVLKVVDIYTNAPIRGASVSATPMGSEQRARDCLKLPGSFSSTFGLRPARDVITDELGRGDFSTCSPRVGVTWAPAPKARLVVSKSEYFKVDRPLLEQRDWLHADDAFYSQVHLVPLVTPSESGDETFSFHVGAGDSRIDLYEPTRITDARRTLIGGTAVDDTSTELTPDAFRGNFLNRGEQRALGLGAQWDLSLFGGGASHSVAASAPGGAGSGRRSVPRALTSLTAWAGWSDVELEYDKIDDQSPGGRDTLWTGGGMAFRLGVAEFVNLGRRPGLYLKLGYEYERMLESDVTRSPGIAAAGGRVLRDEGRYSQQAHEARAVLGWSTRHVSPWAGVRMSRSSVRLAGEAAAEFPVTQGLLEQRISFVNEFEANRALADFGLDVRIPRTRLYLRAEGATDGSDLHVGVSVSHGWRLGR